MSVSFESKETNRGVLTFTISQEQIKPELDRVFNSVKKNLNVPGFRKGHLPRPVFNQRFGEEALYQDTLNALLPAAYEAAVKEAEIEVVAQPQFDVTSTVVIDFVGTVDGVEFDGGKGDNFSLELGSGQFIPGFEDQLVGHAAGETVEVNVTFPEDYQATDLAGKDAKFVTTIHEVKEKEVPALDDELAKDIDEDVETLDELKEKYRKELAESKEAAFDDAVESAALDLAVENAEIIELPEEMVHEEVHRSVNEFLGNMQRQGISPDMYFQITGTTQEDLHKQHEADAEKRTRTNLVIEAVAKAEGFEASDEDIESEISSLATDYNMEVERVRQLLSADMLKHDIAIKKAVELITSTATVK